MKTVRDIYQYLDGVCPFCTQEPWDNSGLLCGSENAPVTTCLLTLDVTAAAVAKAAAIGAELIVAHHPLVFSPVKSVPAGTPLYAAIRANVAVIAAHTCFDKADGGTNDTLCDILGVANPGKYANDIIRTGALQNAVTVRRLAEDTADKLGAAVRFSMPEKIVSTVSVCTGAGGGEIYEAIQSGADCLITGEAKYHEFLDAESAGLAIIAAGHFETEDPAMEALRNRMAAYFPEISFEKFTPTPPITTITR